MLKVIITSSKFEGEVEALYGEDNHLLQIDFQQVDGISERQVHYIKTALPVRYTADGLRELFANVPVIITVTDCEITFEMFWERYKKKINKVRAQLQWNELSNANQYHAYNGIRGYDAYLKATGRYKLDPENYLKRKSWENNWINPNK